MTDISKCKGKGCPIRKECYRYTCEADKRHQSYFMLSPYKDGDCKYFIPDKLKENSCDDAEVDAKDNGDRKYRE